MERRIVRAVTTFATRAWVGCVVVCAMSCSTRVVPVETACFVCASTDDCNPGGRCQRGVCLQPDGCQVAQPELRFTPTRGRPGTVVTVTGDDVADATAFAIGGTTTLLLDKSQRIATVLVVPGTRSGPVVVRLPNTEEATADGVFEVVDAPPWTPTRVERLSPDNAVGAAGVGISVSLSADGRLIAVGAHLDANALGAAWVFRRDDADTPSTQGPKFVDASAARGVAGCQGSCTALNALGTLLAVGGPCNSGAVWTYAPQPDGGWAQVGDRLEGTSTAYQGLGGALSAIGDVMLANVANTGVASAKVFGAIDGGWAPPTMIQGNEAGDLTVSVALSADGRTALINGTQFPPNQPSGWPFSRTPSGWASLGGPLMAPDAVGVPQSHASTTMSADGKTAVLMSLRPTAGRPAASMWVFRRGSDSRWSPDGPRIDLPLALRFARQGQGIAVDFEGRRIFVAGALEGNTGAGVVEYRPSDAGWAPASPVLTFADGGISGAETGPSVALSLDGTTVAVGVAADDGERGAVWILR